MRSGEKEGVLIGSACGEPQHLVRVLTEVWEWTADTGIIHILTGG